MSLKVFMLSVEDSLPTQRRSLRKPLFDDVGLRFL